MNNEEDKPQVEEVMSSVAVVAYVIVAAGLSVLGIALVLVAWVTG